MNQISRAVMQQSWVVVLMVGAVTGLAGGAVDLGSNPSVQQQQASFYSIILTNHAAWDFGRHKAGRQFKLKIAQNEIGGFTNVWPADVRWAGNHVPTTTTQAGRWDVVEVVDDGTHYLVKIYGRDFRDPCVTNCPHALQFDGSQNYVEVPGDSSLCQSVMTIEFWVKKKNPGGWFINNTPSYGAQTGFYFADFYDWTGYYGFGHYDQSGNHYTIFTSTPSASLNNGEWRHLAATVNGRVVKLYVDGRLDAQDNNGFTFTSSTASLFVGAAWADNNCAGIVDEVRISSSVRYSGNFTPPAHLAVDGETIAYWKFDEGTGATVRDETDKHNGALRGDPPPKWVEGR